jgi:2-polyprenyl-3-methyl-5-hydroxy-6-metoxy-1,4-benzoquinol methylase
MVIQGMPTHHIQIPIIVAQMDIDIDCVKESESDGKFFWPAAMALSRRMCQEPLIITSRSVLEIGAGIGIPSITAAILGAKSVHCTDADPILVKGIENNIKINKNIFSDKTEITFGQLNWENDFSQDFNSYDVIIGTEVLTFDTYKSIFDMTKALLVKEGYAIYACDEIMYTTEIEKYADDNGMKTRRMCLVSNMPIEEYDDYVKEKSKGNIFVIELRHTKPRNYCETDTCKK